MKSNLTEAKEDAKCLLPECAIFIDLLDDKDLIKTSNAQNWGNFAQARQEAKKILPELGIFFSFLDDEDLFG